MNTIFISYRREDSQEIAARVIARLEEQFGRDGVGSCLDQIPLGMNIRKHVAAQLAQCTAFVVLIGKNWLRAAEGGQSSIYEPWDVQRVAIESALAAGVPVIPLYVNGASRGDAEALPSALAELLFLNGLSLNEGADFEAQMAVLIQGIESYLHPQAGASPESAAAIPAPGRDQRREELRQAERQIRQKTRSLLLARPAQAKPKGLHTLRDVPIAPELVIIPAGRFLMGSPEGEAERRANEGPQHEVVIRRFAVGKYAVTFDEYDAYARAAGVDLPDDEGWGRGRRPVIHVSWEDAQGYVQWLNQEARNELEGQYYRLLTEAEWEYVCRAGTSTPFYTGDHINTDQANFDGNFSFAGGEKGRSLKATVEVGSYPPNPWGLYDMLGNVWEWVEDRFHDNYRGAPNNGAAWEIGKGANRVLRGGSWDTIPTSLRAAYRNMSPQDSRSAFDGFRIARTL